MPRKPQDMRDGKRFCPGRPATHEPKRIALEHWRRWTEVVRDGSVSHYAPVCKACEVYDRTQAKAEEPARAKIERAASELVNMVNSYYKAIGSEERIGRDFVMRRLHYEHLVPKMEFAMASHHCWESCGEPFKNERDMQLEHREPRRSPVDWARLDARNIDIKCGTCNNFKADKPYAQWLDEQWEIYDEHYRAPVAQPWTLVSPKDWRRPSLSDEPLFVI